MIQVIIIVAFIALVVTFVLVIQFPELINIISTYVDAIIYYLGKALDIVWLFIPKEITIPLMSLAVSVEVITLGYKFVMWILRKVPTASIR